MDEASHNSIAEIEATAEMKASLCPQILEITVQCDPLGTHPDKRCDNLSYTRSTTKVKMGTATFNMKLGIIVVLAVADLGKDCVRPCRYTNVI